MVNKIRILPTNLVNQIAAGEVVERPHSIIKELVENSIDAGSTSIEISIRNGGKTFISVKDNGIGLSQDDLNLCLKPHATSKMHDNNLNNISTLGFRGEALASIASVSKISISSKEQNALKGYQIFSSNGLEEEIQPNNIPSGTLIQVYDLFYCIPARLKFLRTDAVETTYCYKIFKQLALANPNIAFKIENNSKLSFNYPVTGNTEIDKLKNRTSQIMGKEFIDNSIYFEEINPMLRISGYLGLPTYHKNTSEDQFIIINHRSLKDRNLIGIIKFAYSEVLFSGRNPCYCIFIDINPMDIDVNVSPTKSDIRFRDIKLIRHIILSTIKKHLSSISNQNTNNLLSNSLLERSKYLNNSTTSSNFSKKKSVLDLSFFSNNNNYLLRFNDHDKTKKEANQSNTFQEEIEGNHPLGYAKAQFHKNWIVSQNNEGIVIIDQHASHERITQEILKSQYISKEIAQQMLLTPEIIKLQADDMEIARIYQEQINSLGISYDIFGEEAIVINAMPSILGNINPQELMKELISDFKDIESPNNFEKKINNIISTIACHSSIRSGRILNITEMNDLLREMEKTNNYAQCSHGRPTFIKINLKDIERLFSR